MIIGLFPDMGNWVHSMGYFRSFRETISTAFIKKNYILQRVKTKFILKSKKRLYTMYVCSKVYKTMK